jgi:YegS/Rv2252/BmrU family lipid kinase
MPEPAPVAVIINASAGNGCTPEWVGNLADKFHAGRLAARVTLARSGAEIIEAAQRAVADDCPIVVAGGGDGTINAVASQLVGTGIAFGVLPLGTLNHFAKDLNIPLDLNDAIANVIAGHAIKVDAGDVNDRIFLNNSSLGLYPDIVRDREKQQRRLGRGKWFAFFWATMTTLRRYPFLHVRLSLNNKERRRRTPFVFIGNNEYMMEGFNIGKRECLNGGQLSLYITQRPGRFGLFLLAVRALFGRLREVKDFDALVAKEILIETTHKRIRVATDGEVTVMNTPLHYRILPAALNVIVPENIGTSTACATTEEAHAYTGTPFGSPFRPSR